MTPAFSVLDLSPVLDGETVRDALAHSVDLARHVEGLGFTRFWLAEHHNMPGVASAATAIVIGHVAGATSTIRVGSGGIMLPNHAPLVIAEQFGTLASLYPGRIDLGLGRAPGGDGYALRALRRGPDTADRFPHEVEELQFYFREAEEGQPIRAVPGAGLEVPLYLLGSSSFSAELAGLLGLPFAFAAHFAPDALDLALELYRSNFRPSAQLAAPYVIVCTTIVAADTNAEAHRHFTSLQQAFVNLRRGTPGRLPHPVDRIAASPAEKATVDRALRCAIVGGLDLVRSGIVDLIDATKADELMVTSMIYDQTARRRSYDLVAEVRDGLGASRRAA